MRDASSLLFLSGSGAMLASGTHPGGHDVPIVHPCARPDCETLTMGALCLEHEQQRETSRAMRVRRLLPRLATASALVAAATAGALIRSRLPR